MNTLRYEWSKIKTDLIFWFWRHVPYSWLYWSTIQAWADATTTEFTDKHPDEVTWSMMAKRLHELKEGKR